MQRVLSNRLWQIVRRVAARAKRRKAAVAYVTRDLIGFKRGDVLVVDASGAVVRAGETDARLLTSLHRRGVKLYCCPGLHAKVLLLDGIAVIGSGNMSKSSLSGLVEAAIITDNPAVTSGVASFIEQLVAQSEPVDRESLCRLCRIKVVRRGRPRVGVARKPPRISPLGQRTWLVSVTQSDRAYTAAEQRLVDRNRETLARTQKTTADAIEWIRWGGSGPFPRLGRQGDQLIQIWRATPAQRPAVVLRPTTVLLRKRHQGSTFVFEADPKGRNPSMPWAAFKRLMERLGDHRPIGPYSERILDPELAEAIARNWNAACAT